MTVILQSDKNVQAQDIIKRALRLLRIYAPGEAIHGDEINDNLSVLNSMMDYLSLQGLMFYSLTTESFELTTDGVYTIGDGEDFDTERPERINVEASFIRDANGNDYPLRPMTREEYNAITIKSLSGSYPTHLFYDPKFPVGDVCLYPPPIEGLTLYLVSEKAFAMFGDVTDPVTLPAGYQAMLEYNLAIWLNDEYGKGVSKLISTMAIQTLANIESRNAKPVKRNVSGTLGNSSGFSRGNILSGR